jgi:predicted transposase/invertase (TIGR01784 family)
MQAGIDPRMDYAFKKVFGDEADLAPLIDLLNAVVVVPAGRVVKEVDLLNPISQKTFAEEKVAVLDVRARDQAHRQFNLEMQLYVPPSFPKRALYYWADLYRGQLWEGEDYLTLQPAYVISFVNETLFDDEDYHHVLHLRDEKGREFCNDLEVHVVELNKFNLKAEELRTALERWCYFPEARRHAGRCGAAAHPGLPGHPQGAGGTHEAQSG